MHVSLDSCPLLIEVSALEKGQPYVERCLHVSLKELYHEVFFRFMSTLFQSHYLVPLLIHERMISNERHQGELTIKLFGDF